MLPLLNEKDRVVSRELAGGVGDILITRVRTQGSAEYVLGEPSMSQQPIAPRARSDDGHITVLLEEAIISLAPRAGGIYVDGTFGGGGHTRRLLSAVPPVGRVIALDADREAQASGDNLTDTGRFTFVHANFRDLDAVLDRLGVVAIDGLLLDLGMSSYQLDEADRGFSFRADAPLDMRFDRSVGISAAELLGSLDEQGIAELIWEFGEDRHSRRIAAAIVKNRRIAPIVTTLQLASIVEGAVGGRRSAPIHPATKTFQALRIAVNDELGSLGRVLHSSVSRLAPGGRVVVISFHSLEDRMVKRWIQSESGGCVCPPEQPMCTCNAKARLKRIGRTIRPSVDEQRRNSRSRSAIMRVAERLPADVPPQL